jgi:NADPH:quinone reductase-like Zn-dependent oxidoreductase
VVDTASLGDAAVAAARDGGTVVSLRGGDGIHERGVVTASMVVFDHAREHGELDRLRQLAQDGRLTLRVAQALPAEEAVQAHRLLEAGGLRGRIVLTF